MKHKDYKGNIFILEIPEGGSMENAYVRGFGVDPINGRGFLLVRKHPVRFYCKVVAFRDDIAPMRDWGSIDL